jgi:hypothetical protein
MLSRSRPRAYVRPKPANSSPASTRTKTTVYEDTDPEAIEMERQADLRRCAADLLVVERAKELLLGE